MPCEVLKLYSGHDHMHVKWGLSLKRHVTNQT